MTTLTMTSGTLELSSTLWPGVAEHDLAFFVDRYFESVAAPPHFDGLSTNWTVYGNTVRISLPPGLTGDELLRAYSIAVREICG